jgi:parvulin-like peptidyl-prolyl isomerase
LEFRKVKLFVNAFIAAIVVFTANAVFAQESQEKVVDEVVAQVNNDVITLSRVRKEMQMVVDADVQQGKDKAVAIKAVNEKQGELIAGLINEELLIQRAKEVGIDKDAEVEVNQRFAAIMKQYNLKTLDALYKAMESQGVNPQDMRDNWRKQAIREMLIQRELQSKVYWEPTAKEVKDYFEKNKGKFTKPELLTLSEIFLAFAGRDEAACPRESQAACCKGPRGCRFSRSWRLKTLKGKMSLRQKARSTRSKWHKIEQADAKIAAAVKNLKKGDITEPLDSEDIGVVIFRVDERTAASTESYFDEKAVRMAILQERLPVRPKAVYGKASRGGVHKSKRNLPTAGFADTLRSGKKGKDL